MSNAMICLWNVCETSWHAGLDTSIHVKCHPVQGEYILELIGSPYATLEAISTPPYDVQIPELRQTPPNSPSSTYIHRILSLPMYY